MNRIFNQFCSLLLLATPFFAVSAVAEIYSIKVIDNAELVFKSTRRSNSIRRMSLENISVIAPGGTHLGKIHGDIRISKIGSPAQGFNIGSFDLGELTLEQGSYELYLDNQLQGLVHINGKAIRFEELPGSN